MMACKGYCLIGILMLEHWRYLFMVSRETENLTASKDSEQKIQTVLWMSRKIKKSYGIACKSISEEALIVNIVDVKYSKTRVRPQKESCRSIYCWYVQSSQICIAHKCVYTRVRIRNNLAYTANTVPAAVSWKNMSDKILPDFFRIAKVAEHSKLTFH